MRRGLLLLGVFIVLLAAPSIVRYLNYNSFETVDRGEIPTYNPIDLVEVEPTPPSSSFVDEPQVGQGSVLLDMAHDNAFTLDELEHFNGRVSARGFDMVPFTGGNLAAQLRAANAFVVITPLSEFSFAEVQAVKDFVNRGGKLLLIGDPTRYNIELVEEVFEIVLVIEDDKIPLNSLSSEFDITFKGDYLYNLIENEGNFKNILIGGSNLADSPLTEEIEQVAFYGAHSLTVGSEGTVLFSGGDDTWSSATDRPGGLALGATSQNGRVLAISDIQFMTNPYHTSYDNGRLVAHIADFLTDSESREFVLADFPYFYEDTANLVYAGNPELGPQIFAQVIELQNAFQSVGKQLVLAAAADAGEDTLSLGLYNQADETVLEILASNGISMTIEPPILTDEEMAAEEDEADSGKSDEEGEEESSDAASSDDVEEGDDSETEQQDETEEEIRIVHTPLGDVNMAGTAVVLLDESGGNGRQNVIVLAASKDGLDNTVSLLLDIIPLDADYTEAGCVVQQNLALCPTNIADEEVEAELVATGEPEEESQTEDEGEEESGEDEPPPVEDLDAEPQGPISLGETVESELDDGVSHAWTFSDGPAVIDIIADGGEGVDLVLEVYDPNNEFVTSSDSTFTGDIEEIIGLEIEDSGSYSIIVRDYYENGGSYSLSVLESEESPDEEGENGTIENIFVFVDDGGEPLSGGIDSAAVFIDLLGTDYEINTWVSSIDGPLEEDLLEETDLLIWDSGDYRDIDAFSDDDIFILFSYLDSGRPMLLTGSSPPMFSDSELATVSDLEVTGDDPVLLDGLESGEIIELGGDYDVVIPDVVTEELEEGSAIFFLRGPGSEASGEVIGMSSIDDLTEQRSVLLLLPYVILPEDVQTTLLENMLAWFVED